MQKCLLFEAGCFKFKIKFPGRNDKQVMLSKNEEKI